MFGCGLSSRGSARESGVFCFFFSKKKACLPVTLQFDHWPFVAGAYGIFLAIASWLTIAAALRLKRAGAKLRAVDPRNRE